MDTKQSTATRIFHTLYRFPTLDRANEAEKWAHQHLDGAAEFELIFKDAEQLPDISPRPTAAL